MKKQHKHQPLFLPFISFCLFFFVGSGSTFAQEAYSFDALRTGSARSASPDAAYHLVKRGETLYSISRQYDMTVGELKSLNGLRGNLIKAGHRLKVQAPASTARGLDGVVSFAVERGRGQAAPPSQPLDQIDAELEILADTRASYPPPIARSSEYLPPVVPASSLPNTLSLEKKQYYKVRKGDDLYSIADTYEVSVDELKSWNALTEVRPGDVLVVRKWYETVDRSVTDLPANEPAAADHGNLIRTSSEAASLRLQRAVEEESMSLSRLAEPQTQARGMVQPVSEGYRPQASEWTRGTTAVTGPYLEYENKAYNNQRFYASHPTLPIGSTIKMALPDNPGYIELVVVDRMVRGYNAVVGLSPACAKILRDARTEVVTIRH